MQKKVCSSHYFLYNSKFQAKSKMSDMAHCHQNISLCSCALSYWSRSRKFQKSPKQALSSGIRSQCWHPRQVWISFRLKNDYASNCCSTRESSYCKSVRSCPTERPCWDLCSRSAARGDGATRPGARGWALWSWSSPGTSSGLLWGLGEFVPSLCAFGDISTCAGRAAWPCHLSVQESRVNQSEKQNAPVLQSPVLGLGSLLSNAGKVCCWEYSKSNCSWIPGCLLRVGLMLQHFSWDFSHLFSCMCCFLKLCPTVGSGCNRLWGSEVTGLCGTGL